MVSSKRKLETFDPNKSDSNDTDFDPTEARPRKSAKKSRTKGASGGGPRKKTKYKGSDVSDDDAEDSLLEDSFSDAVDEEDDDVEMNEKTGRAVRKAAKKSVNYEDPSESEIDEIVDDMESEDDRPRKGSKFKRARPAVQDDDSEEEEPPTARKRSKIVTLKLTPAPSRSTRAGSAARTRGSVEPISAGLRTGRSTRARTVEGDEPVELSTSGHHVIRASRSPEAIGRSRASRGSKGVKQPASTIKEETHETSSYEQEEQKEAGEDVTMANEIAGTDEPEADDDIIEMEAAVEAGAGDEGQAQHPVGLNDDDDDDDDDDAPIVRPGRTRGSRAGIAIEEAENVASDIPEVVEEPAGETRRLTRGSKSKQRKGGAEVSSDFEPPDEASEDEISASDAEPRKSKAGEIDNEYESSPGRRGRAARAGKSKSNSRRRSALASEEELDEDELAEELHDLKQHGNRRRRPRDNDLILFEENKGRRGRERKPVDYSIKPMDQIYAADEDGEDAAPTPSRRARGGRTGASQPWERNLYSTFGPFGGGGGPTPLIGGPWGTGAAGGADSDSSDDENMHRPSNVGGNVGMTPTSAFPPQGLLPGLGQTNNPEAMAGLSGTPANLGKIKSQKALADADPLGVDQNVDFSKIGGLQGHIDQLKEMVQMPLLYPELFLKFNVTPPRGVLFHGPPGTGKTLLARALAAQTSSGGRKITFYMRKGADALSKWVGEAERQLRLLFEEARKTQPSIIFFDEIDGLAPVRSSKQEQIHASIVSTLLALMDGMDGRGQVIVIGATNRPDNIDPALRRPGRFDREFYFPLPDVDARKSIINIHTKDWGINDGFKDSLALVTKGYGGADLRALCTEAALNAMQRTYPQIYSSNEKLKVDPDQIKITAKDFMLSVKKMIPSSERATSSGAAPLPKVVEPLLRHQLQEIEGIVDGLIPIKKKTTALQEALYEQFDDDDDHGFGRETMQQDFEKARVFRPRLLIGGTPGMGQAYLGGALLNHFEGLHVQSFDLPTIFSDSARSPEAAVVQMFAEVKRHKPSVIYLPAIEHWYRTVGSAVITTFVSMLNSIPPTDPVLVLGITDSPVDKVDQRLATQLFGFSRANRHDILRPSRQSREEFFSKIVTYVKMSPKDYPEPLNRKKRKLPVLEVAPPPPPKPPTKEELKAQKKKDHQVLNHLKLHIQPIMDQIQKKYRKFRTPVILQSQIQYLIDEQDPNHVRPDIAGYRPFEMGTNKDGVKGLRETMSGKFYYNLETTTIEERLSNGFYARPKDFLADIRSLAKDAKRIGDKERTLKANELLANVEVDIAMAEANPIFVDCENIYQRQLQRTKQMEEKARRQAESDLSFGSIVRSGLPSQGLQESGDATSGPVILGEAVPASREAPLLNPVGISGRLSNTSRLPASNGTSNASRLSGDDVEMGGTSDNTQRTSQNSQAMPPPHQQWPRMPSGPANTSNLATVGGNTQVSQYSGFQELPHDTSPSQLINDASTTTSGKKTSEGWSTQATNGVSHPDSSPLDRVNQDSQLPDTQRNPESQEMPTLGGNSSEDQFPHSQADGIARGSLLPTYPSQTPSTGSQPSPNPTVPPFSTAPPRLPASRAVPTSMANILNDSPVEPNSSQVSSEKDLILDEQWVGTLLDRFTEGSSGCSVEQLEQINRELMEHLWAQRGEYNRSKVAFELTGVFNKTIRDIEDMQRVLKASQDESQHE